MKTIIRLMSDWGLYPFYVHVPDDVTFNLIDLEPFQEMFSLPDSVIAVLLEWDELYQNHLVWDDPASTRWPSAAYRANYVEQGRAAARELRRHLPPDVCIRYVADGNIPTEHF